MADEKQKSYEVEHNLLFTIEQKGNPPLVVTRSVGGEIIFTRTEFSVRIGVHPSTLRTWEHKGMFIPAYISSNGTRYYTEEQAQQYLKAHQKGKHTDRRI